MQVSEIGSSASVLPGQNQGLSSGGSREVLVLRDIQVAGSIDLHTVIEMKPPFPCWLSAESLSQILGGLLLSFSKPVMVNQSSCFESFLCFPFLLHLSDSTLLSPSSTFMVPCNNSGFTWINLHNLPISMSVILITS